MARTLRTTLRSAAVGGVATAADLLVLSGLVELLGWDPQAANVPALLLGLLGQFLGNKFLAFEDRSSDWARQGLAFLGVEAGALLLSGALFHLLIAGGATSYLLVRIGVQALVYFGFSLPLWSRIFRERTSS